MQNIQLRLGDCIEVMKKMKENSIDAIVTDPPAGIAFMGKDWDKDKGGRDKWIEWMTGVASECIRVLKPGGHALVWSLPRTSHWTATAWEDAGFEVRDRIAHIFGSGFPKSMNISKQIDKMAGAEREIIEISNRGSGAQPNKLMNHDTGDTGIGYADGSGKEFPITAPATEESKQWDGWGTALKPSVEDWWLFRKPCSEKTVTQNVLKWGTGAINIDTSRVPVNPEIDDMLRTVERKEREAETWKEGSGFKNENNHVTGVPTNGRWPAQVIHDGSEEVVSLFPQSNGGAFPKKGNTPAGEHYEGGWGAVDNGERTELGNGSAARFFYCTKPSKKERDAGLDEFEERERNTMGSGLTGISGNRSGKGNGIEIPMGINKMKNHHPTVKPLSLMRYLITLITPPDGIVLDPFLGSGTTLVAAKELGFSGRGIEKDPEYFEIAKKRIDSAKSEILA
jgi:site-specific DNA-methyltransferase (adenine-specific)